MPLRAINTAGKWRIVVNGVKAHYETLTQVQRSSKTKTKLKIRYGQTKRKTKVMVLSKIFSLTLNIFQTARVEECSTPGSPCPLVPACYDTSCVQVAQRQLSIPSKAFGEMPNVVRAESDSFLSHRNRSTTGSWSTTPMTSISPSPLRRSSCRQVAPATTAPTLSPIDLS